MAKIKIQMGVMARDTITGFEGVCIARTEFLYGCVHVCLKPKSLDKNGLPKEAQWFDEPQVELMPKKKKIKGTSRTGGPGVRPPERDHG